MKFWKSALALMLTLALVLSFVACSSTEAPATDAEGETAQEGETTEEKIVLNVFHRWPNEPINSMMTDLTNQYMEENPHIEIVMDATLNDQYKEKIRMVVTGDDVPDVFCSWSGSFAQEMIDSGNVATLNDIYEADTDWSGQISQASIDGFTFGEDIYGVPWSQDGKAICYNVDIFEEHGLEVPATWTEFTALLDELQGLGYEVPIVEGLTSGWASIHWLGTILQRVVDPEVLANDYNAATGEFTDPAYLEALELWEELTYYFGDISTAIDRETARATMFFTQESPLYYLQFAEITTVEQEADFNYSFFNFPEVETGAGDPNALTGAPEGWMISNQTEHKEEAVAFVKWLVSTEQGIVLTERGGYLSSITSAITPETALGAQVDAMSVIQEASFLAPWFDNACDPSIYTVFQQGAVTIATGDATPEEVIANVQAAAEQLRAES